LFIMQYMLDEIPPSPVEPTPTPTPAPTLEPTSTPVIATPTPLPSFGSTPPSSGLPKPGNFLWMGVVPALLLLAGVTLFRVIPRIRQQ
jgi:hypothetical protein